jgi:hypothetical protein
MGNPYAYVEAMAAEIRVLFPRRVWIAMRLAKRVLVAPDRRQQHTKERYRAADGHCRQRAQS